MTADVRKGDDEELNRRWDEQLQELRVMQTGAQLTAGFLLTLPFQGSFADLDALQRAVSLSLLSAAVTVASLVGGVVTLIMDVVVGRTAGVVTGGSAAALASALLWMLPRVVAGRDAPRD